jgi:hypothetical protein
MQSTPEISDPLQSAVILLVDAMRTDYAQQFRAGYPGKDDVRQLKRRLYQLMRTLDPKHIFTGYEAAEKAKPGNMPTVPEIVTASYESKKQAERDEANQGEAKAAMALPPPPKNAPMPPNIRKLWSRILQESSKTEEEREARLPELLATHNALLANHYAQGKIRHVAPALKLCACCGNLGVLSHSIRGDGNWFCSLHWRPS